MNILKHSWVLFLTLIAVVNTGYADTVTWSENISVNNTDARVTVRILPQHRIETRNVEVPAELHHRVLARAVRVGGHSGGQSLQVQKIQISGDQVVVVGQRLVSQWKHRQHQPGLWVQQVRVTFPRHYLASSWDVVSLQRELERLGIKIKPKPTSPKPTQQLSG